MRGLSQFLVCAILSGCHAEAVDHRALESLPVDGLVAPHAPPADLPKPVQKKAWTCDCALGPVDGSVSCLSASCDDGNTCTFDVCVDGQCMPQGARPVAWAGTACDDGDACTTADRCTEGGACVAQQWVCGPQSDRDAESPPPSAPEPTAAQADRVIATCKSPQTVAGALCAVWAMYPTSDGLAQVWGEPGEPLILTTDDVCFFNASEPVRFAALVETEQGPTWVSGANVAVTVGLQDVALKPYDVPFTDPDAWVPAPPFCP